MEFMLSSKLWRKSTVQLRKNSDLHKIMQSYPLMISYQDYPSEILKNENKQQTKIRKHHRVSLLCE